MVKRKAPNKRSNMKKSTGKKKPIYKKAAKTRIRKLMRIETIDQILLSMAAKPYDKILKQIQSGKKRINDERKLALQMGTKILNRAKKVRDSLISSKNS